jgi:Flp pilus assembly protein TadB
VRPAPARPALVPAAIAVALPIALARWSLLAAGLSLLVSAVLVVLAVLIHRESRQAALMRHTAAQLLGLPAPAGTPTPGSRGGSRR